MPKYLTLADLAATREEDFEVEPDQWVRLRRLDADAITGLVDVEGKVAQTLAMIAVALVEPVLTADEVRTLLPTGWIPTLEEKILAMNRLAAGQKAVPFSESVPNSPTSAPSA